MTKKIKAEKIEINRLAFEELMAAVLELHDLGAALSDLMAEATGKGVVQDWGRVNRICIGAGLLNRSVKKIKETM